MDESLNLAVAGLICLQSSILIILFKAYAEKVKERCWSKQEFW
jgi:hypothetical protein